MCRAKNTSIVIDEVQKGEVSNARILRSQRKTPATLIFTMRIYGLGTPIILISWISFEAELSWEKAGSWFFCESGHRVITYDRRGFGQSRASPPLDTTTTPSPQHLHKLVTHLELPTFALCGFSMGGGEVARYLGTYGSKRPVSKAVFISAVPPYLLKASDNPEGVDASVFEGIQKAIVADRYAFFTEFFKNFYNADLLLGKRVSDQAMQASWNIAVGCSATATLACVPTWHEDFRQDITSINVPTLVIQGDADRIVPIAASGQRSTAKLIKGEARLAVSCLGGPHCISWTHAEVVNRELIGFLGKKSSSGVAA